MHHRHTHETAPQTRGVTIHWAKLYDKLSLWQILTLGRGVKLWEKMLDLAGLKTGDRVLDVGCGPGSLTLKAKARVGETGQTFGIDASPEMIEVARTKAQRAETQVDFRLEVVEKLPFPNQSFDVVLSSLMMHHLPDDLKRQALKEIHRVLKPGGVLVIFDFKRRDNRSRHIFLAGHFHPSVAVGIQELAPMLNDAGFERIEFREAQLKMFGYLRGFASH